MYVHISFPTHFQMSDLDEADAASHPWPIANIHGMRPWAMFVVTATALVETNVIVKIDLPIGTLMWGVEPEVCD